MKKWSACLLGVSSVAVFSLAGNALASSIDIRESAAAQPSSLNVIFGQPPEFDSAASPSVTLPAAFGDADSLAPLSEAAVPAPNFEVQLTLAALVDPDGDAFQAGELLAAGNLVESFTSAASVAAVPEPSSLLLLLTGVLGGLFLRLRRKHN